MMIRPGLKIIKRSLSTFSPCQHIPIITFHIFKKGKRLYLRYGLDRLYKCPILQFWCITQLTKRQYFHIIPVTNSSHAGRKRLKNRNIILRQVFRYFPSEGLLPKKCSCKYWPKTVPEACTRKPENKNQTISLLVPTYLIWSHLLIWAMYW